MKLKLCCIFLSFLAGNMALAGAIVDRTIKNNSSAIQPSSFGSSSQVYSLKNPNLDIISLYPAIEEIQSNIQNNPNDYSLYVSLADLYLKTKQYDKAYDELIFLNNLKQKNKLNSEIIQQSNELMNTSVSLLKTERRKSSLYINMSVISLILGKKESAMSNMEMAANNISDFKLIKKALIKVTEYTQSYQSAVKICEKISTQNPSDTELKKIKAGFLLQLNNKQAAIDEYLTVLDITPNDIEVKYILFKLITSENVSDKEVINILYKKPEKKNLEQAYSDLANMLVQNNDIDNSKKYIEILIKKYPDNVNGYILLSEIYRKEGKLKESYDILNKVKDKVDSNEAISQYNVLLAKLSDEPVQEANSLMANGLYKEALEVLNSASQENLYVILGKVRANYFLSNKQKTFDLLNKAMSLYPNNSDVFCAFGYIYLKEKDIDSARKYVNQSLKINPENRTTLDLLDMVNKAESDKYINQIASSLESQNYTEAMRLINEALDINKKDSVLYYYKGLTYIAQNNYAASTAALYKCIELNPKNVLAYFYLGIAFDNLSEPKNALMYYKKFIELLPQDDYGESEKLKYAKARIQKLTN